MIFIGAELSDPHAHFVTNIVASIGSGNDLVIDLLKVVSSEIIFDQITRHVQDHDERFVVYNPYTDEDFFLCFKRRFPRLKLITVFSDDEWRHTNYDRYLALYSDVFTIAVKSNLEVYRGYGLNAFYMQWACNPTMFYPLPDQQKDIDVSFIGAAYGQRIDYIRVLIANGINVRVFGRGWDRHSDICTHWGGYLSSKEMFEVISRSRINLNFLWTSADKKRCTIKGRTLELSACRAFQLSNFTDEFDNYGFIDGYNIAVFHDKDDFLEKVRHYLKRDNERESIAVHGYDHALRYHTWEQRFKAIFERLKKTSVSSTSVLRKYRIIILVKEGIRHRISPDDERLNIQLMDLKSDWRKTLSTVDGIVRLTRDSSLNNESLYMMAFGLMADRSDVIATNFFIVSKAKRRWIQFRDILLEHRRILLRILPVECMMFSSAYVAKHGCELMPDTNQLRMSYIEYPSFCISLPYYHSRKLQLYFGYYRGARQRLREHIQNMRFDKALSLGIDRLWQKILLKRAGA